MIAAAGTQRNRAIVSLLYYCGLRVSELAGLTWFDARPRQIGGQITVLGKGNKRRTILVDVDVWTAMTWLKADVTAVAGVDRSPIFRGPQGNPISASQIGRIVRSAAKRAAIDKPVSPHWLRHCYCSHALDRGAPIHLVQRDAGHANIATTSHYAHARPNESAGSYLKKRETRNPNDESNPKSE